MAEIDFERVLHYIGKKSDEGVDLWTASTMAPFQSTNPEVIGVSSSVESRVSFEDVHEVVDALLDAMTQLEPPIEAGENDIEIYIGRDVGSSGGMIVKALFVSDGLPMPKDPSGLFTVNDVLIG